MRGDFLADTGVVPTRRKFNKKKERGGSEGFIQRRKLGWGFPGKLIIRRKKESAGGQRTQ